MIVRTAAAAAALALVLSGCTGDEDPPPGALPSLSPSASPSPTVPPLPAAADADTPEAAAEFAKYYLTLVTLAFQQAEPDLLTTFSDAQCEGCSALRTAVEELANDGQRTTGGDFAFENAVAPASSTSDYLVLLDYTRSATQIRDLSGNVVSEEPAVPFTTAQMRVVRQNDQWRVLGYRTGGVE